MCFCIYSTPYWFAFPFFVTFDTFKEFLFYLLAIYSMRWLIIRGGFSSSYYLASIKAMTVANSLSWLSLGISRDHIFKIECKLKSFLISKECLICFMYYCLDLLRISVIILCCICWEGRLEVKLTKGVWKAFILNFEQLLLIKTWLLLLKTVI